MADFRDAFRNASFVFFVFRTYTPDDRREWDAWMSGRSNELVQKNDGQIAQRYDVFNR